MFIPKGHLKGFFIATGLLGVTVSAGVLASGSLGLFLKRNANGEPPYTRTLDATNQPTLSSGAGTRTDDVGVIWEYYNASDYANGHVSLSHNGYVGIKSNTPWGIPGITSITADFTVGTGGELWLLKSVDGIEWHEVEILEDDEPITYGDDWRFVRFYYFADNSGNTGSVNINSIEINYSCDSPNLSATEAIDSAHENNVIATTGLTASTETTSISPNSIGGEAVRFTKTGSSSTEFTIGFNRSYTLGETAYSKIEFDVWTTVTNYGKKITLMNNTTSLQSTADTNNTNSYIWTPLGNNWYHAEIPMTFFVSLISGYLPDKDIPSTGIENKVFNAIKLNQGNCIIDNLRIGSSVCDLGIYNSTTYQPSVNEIYWAKTSWVGKLYNDKTTITFDDDTKARHIPATNPNLKNGSPFYFEILSSGSLTFTVNVVCGYNHRTQTISRTITVK